VCFNSRPPLKSIEVVGPFECASMGFLETNRSQVWLGFSRLPNQVARSIPCKEQQSKDSGEMPLIWKHEVPSLIIHDHAAEFLSEAPFYIVYRQDANLPSTFNFVHLW